MLASGLFFQQPLAVYLQYRQYRCRLQLVRPRHQVWHISFVFTNLPEDKNELKKQTVILLRGA